MVCATSNLICHAVPHEPCANFSFVFGVQFANASDAEVANVSRERYGRRLGAEAKWLRTTVFARSTPTNGAHRPK